jgi:hypothetical protein
MQNNDFTIETLPQLPVVGIRKTLQGYTLRTIKDRPHSVNYIETLVKLKTPIGVKLVMSPQDPAYREELTLDLTPVGYEFQLDSSNIPMWVDIYLHENIDRAPIPVAT